MTDKSSKLEPAHAVPVGPLDYKEWREEAKICLHLGTADGRPGEEQQRQKNKRSSRAGEREGSCCTKTIGLNQTDQDK